MGRKLLIRTNKYPYHITTRSRNRDWYNISTNDIWKIYLEALAHANKKYFVILHAFVLMNNHYHIILSTPNSNIDRFMFELNRIVSLKIRSTSKRTNQIFGGRYKWSLICDTKYLHNVCKYVYQNPLKVNLVKCCEDYRFSSLNRDGMKDLSFIKLNPLIDIYDPNIINWLNKQINRTEDSSIKLGLTRGNPGG